MVGQAKYDAKKECEFPEEKAELQRVAVEDYCQYFTVPHCPQDSQ